MTSLRTPPAELRQAIYDIDDPELPHVTIGDLGMVRSVVCDPDGHTAVITITPTYTGCPATEQIADDVTATARALGWDAVTNVAMAPAWSTDWITDRGKDRLKAAGIAPPASVAATDTTPVDGPIECPRCGSYRTRRVAQFGSTACKASYACHSCAEPFDYFKPF